MTPLTAHNVSVKYFMDYFNFSIANARFGDFHSQNENLPRNKLEDLMQDIVDEA